MRTAALLCATSSVTARHRERRARDQPDRRKPRRSHHRRLTPELFPARLQHVDRHTGIRQQFHTGVDRWSYDRQVRQRTVSDSIYGGCGLSAAARTRSKLKVNIFRDQPLRRTSVAPKSSSNATFARAYSSSLVSESMPVFFLAAATRARWIRPPMRPLSPSRRPGAERCR
jgi:hypothetical protein